MKKNILRKGIICGILIILIGLSFTPSISGDVKKISNQSPVEFPAISYLDFTNGYWKFDECSGDIAYDSSGHDFDGLINGATWITYGAGCALEFDGINDFVGLDDHSAGVGLNKTDDAIFTGHFRSSSTEDGLIYSMSDSWNTENPEFSIQLCGNGSLLLQIWVNQCGIKIYSDDADFNDDEWHNFEVIYHGTTSKPTVDLFVDNDFEGTITEWLCSMFADEYKRAKIGRRAVAAERHFEGAIDRIKIIKYPGGNQEPSRPVIDGDHFGMPGEEMCFTFVSEDYEGDQLEYYIDWGDGDIENWIGPSNPGEPITECHTYDEIGSYQITAKARDFWHDGLPSDPFFVDIGNHAPWDPETPSGPGVGSINIEYTYSTTTSDEEDDPIWYKWSWGDGIESDWMGPYDSDVICEASHTWTEPGTYQVKAKAKDEIGESDWSKPSKEVSIVISALKIDEITGGLFFVNSVIRNSGSWEANNVIWDIKLNGGLILIGGESSGEISSIPIGERRDIRSGFILGLGPTVVTVTTQAPDGSHDEYDRNAVMLLFYIHINPGG